MIKKTTFLAVSEAVKQMSKEGVDFGVDDVIDYMTLEAIGPDRPPEKVLMLRSIFAGAVGRFYAAPGIEQNIQDLIDEHKPQ